MSQAPVIDLPVNAAIVVVGAIAMIIIGRYVFRSSKGDTLEPLDAHQHHHLEDRS